MLHAPPSSQSCPNLQRLGAPGSHTAPLSDVLAANRALRNQAARDQLISAPLHAPRSPKETQKGMKIFHLHKT